MFVVLLYWKVYTLFYLNCLTEHLHRSFNAGMLDSVIVFCKASFIPVTNVFLTKKIIWCRQAPSQFLLFSISYYTTV